MHTEPERTSQSRSHAAIGPNRGFGIKPPEGMEYVVVVDAPTSCWLSDMSGDPGRTCLPEHATRFETIWTVRDSLAAVKAQYPGRAFVIGMLPKLNSAVRT